MSPARIAFALLVLAGCGPSPRTLAPSPHLRSLRRPDGISRAVEQHAVLDAVCQAVTEAYDANPVGFADPVQPPPKALTDPRARRVWSQLQAAAPADKRAFARASAVHVGPSYVCEGLPGPAPCNYDCVDSVEELERRAPPRIQGRLRHPRLTGPRALSYVIGHAVFTEDLATGARRMRRRELDRGLSGFLAYGPYLYLSTDAPNETRRIARVDPNDAYHPLTPGAPVRADIIGASPQHLFFTADWRARGTPDLFSVPHGEQHPTRRLLNPGNWAFDAMSDDGAWLVGRQVRGDAVSLLAWRLDALEAPPRPLATPEGLGAVYGFEPGSHRLWFSARGGREWLGVHTLDVDAPDAPAKLRWAAEEDQWVDSLGPRANLAVVRTRRGTARDLELRALDSAEQVNLPKLDGALLDAHAAPDAAEILLLTQDETTRHVLRWRPQDALLTTLTSSTWTPTSDGPGPGAARLGSPVAVEETVMKLPDGIGGTFEAVVLRPAAASPETPAPVVLLLHGGPGGAFSRGLGPLERHWAEQGISVFALNHRGSAGYGKTFSAADDREHGLVDLQDVLAAANHVAALPWTRADRVALVGTSYGGFLAVRALAAAPERFVGAITLYGAFDLELERQREDLDAVGRAWLRRELGRPGARPRLDHDLERLKAPLLIAYGTADPRAPRAQTERVLDALLARGHPTASLALLGAGHGAIYVDQAPRLRAATTRFLRRCLF